MLFSEIIYNVKNLISGGVSSDDDTLNDSQFAFIINYYRSKLIKQEQEKGKFTKSLFIQNLGEVPLIQVDKNECCEGTCILRTMNKIPIPIESNNGLNLTFVGTLGGKPFQKYTHNSTIWKHAAKWTAKEPGFYYQNGYLYIIDPPSLMIDTINIQGIFENPKEALTFRTCDCPANGEECFDTYDFNYPTPTYMVDTIVKMIGDAELKLLLSLPPDISNDSLNNIENVGGK